MNDQPPGVSRDISLKRRAQKRVASALRPWFLILPMRPASARTGGGGPTKPRNVNNASQGAPRTRRITRRTPAYSKRAFTSIAYDLASSAPILTVPLFASLAYSFHLTRPLNELIH
jgi:hypothetical protein